MTKLEQHWARSGKKCAPITYQMRILYWASTFLGVILSVPRFGSCKGRVKNVQQLLLLQVLVDCQRGMLVDCVDFGGLVANMTAGRERTEPVVEVVLLVHLGFGEDAGESDGEVGAALRTVGRGPEKRVSPVPLK